MLISTYYDEELDLLVSRHGGSFLPNEGSAPLLDFVRAHNKTPQHVIMDTRGVSTADLAGTDRARAAHAARDVAEQTQGEVVRIKLIILTSSDPEHVMNQRFRRLLAHIDDLCERNGDTETRTAIVHNWRDALVAAALPETLEWPFLDD